MTKSSISAVGLLIHKGSKKEIDLLKTDKHNPRRRFYTFPEDTDLIEHDGYGFVYAADLSLKQILSIDSDAQDEDFANNYYNLFLAQIVNIIELSPVGSALLNDAADRNWRVHLVDLDNGDFLIDPHTRLIEINHHGLKPEGLMRSAYFGNQVLLNLVRALRDVWHEKRQTNWYNLFAPEGLLLLERCRSADCDVLSILVAWELRSEGHTDIWRHCIGSDIGDMAMMYSQTLERDPAAQFNGKALYNTFKSWFDSEERSNNSDHQTLEYLDDMLESGHDKKDFGKKMPTHIAIELLSCMPDKTAYLQGHGREILMGPNFSGLNDPMNQTHLMHILYDMEATIINNVPFRDAELAARIFPPGTGILEDQ